MVDDDGWSDRQIHEPIRVAMRDLLTIRRRYGKSIEECPRPRIGGKRIVDGEHDAVRAECHERGYERRHREEPAGRDPDLIEERLANRAAEQPLRLSGVVSSMRSSMNGIASPKGPMTIWRTGWGC